MRAPLLAALVSALAACGDGLYTAQGLPPLGGGTCQPPQRLCAQGCFLPNALEACGSACEACGTSVPGATAICEPFGQDHHCGIECPAGQLRVASGCAAPIALAGGDAHTCAIAQGGLLKCWGANGAGQVSPGAGSPVLLPLDVRSGASAVAAGPTHTCAALGAGRTVECWGAGGGIAQLPSPAPAGVESIATGVSHTCVLQSGAVRCWGANDLGQIGSGTPVASGAVAIAGGANHTCARLGTGAVTCWGDASRSQTGGGNPLGAGGWSLLAAGSNHSCAADPAALDLLCWGDNSLNQLPLLGNPVSTPTAPQRSGGRPITVGNHVLAMAAGGAHTCVVIDHPGAPEHGLSCFGDNTYGQLGVAFAGELLSLGAVSVGTSVFAAGASHTCALFPTDGLLRCWGRNQAGQLGAGDAAAVPVGTLVKVSGR